MSKEKGEDDLEKGASRLGDRFSGSSEAGDGEQTAEEQPEQIEWVPATLYLPEERRKEFRRFLKRITLDYPEIEDADKRELHAAALSVAMDHPEQVAETAEEIMEQG